MSDVMTPPNPVGRKPSKSAAKAWSRLLLDQRIAEIAELNVLQSRNITELCKPAAAATDPQEAEHYLELAETHLIESKKTHNLQRLLNETEYA